MNKNILIFAIILVILIIFAYYTLRSNVVTKSAVLNGHQIVLEIANSDAEREKGLSGRDNLPKDKGLLFLFNRPDTYAFWMKDMRFPIDIIFLRDDKIMKVYRDIPAFLPGTKTQNLTNYAPAVPSDKVLELNAGQAKEFGVKEGDTIKLNL